MGDQSNIKLKKNISTFSLMMTGITAMVGSGWLLSTQRLSNIAGPAALVAWFVGMVIAMLVALCFLEVGSSIRSAGGIGFYSKVTHGKFSGFLTSWINWLSIVTVPAIEAQAIVQYLSQMSPYCMSWYDSNLHMMTNTGIFYAIVLMLFFMYINYWSVQLFIKFNNVLTIIKFVVPVLTVVCLAYIGLHPSNFGSTMQEFVPFGWTAVFTSVVSCGVVMSFNGFQVPMNFSEEIRSPRTQLPLAVLGGILVTFFLYLALQAVFIGVLDPKYVAGGWGNINFRSPYVNLLLIANFQVMVWVVYVSSALAPAACGAAFIASSSRMLYALSTEKMLPAFLSKLNVRYRSPRYAVIACTLIGCVYLFLFRSWAQLVTVVSVLHIFSYLPAPIIVISNRLKLVSHSKVGNSQFKLPLATILAPVLFFILSLLLFLAAWPLTAEMALLVSPGLIFFYYYELKNATLDEAKKLFKGASWIVYYLVGMSILCYLGNNKGGVNVLSMEVSVAILAVFSLVLYIYAAYFAYDRREFIISPE